jgi:hypothetical protein
MHPSDSSGFENGSRIYGIRKKTAGLKAFLQSGFGGCLEAGKYHMELFIASDGNYDEQHNIQIQ